MKSEHKVNDMRNLGLFTAFPLFAVLLACEREPVALGAIQQPIEAHSKKQLENNKALCALYGDSSCSAYLEDVASFDAKPPPKWWDPVWFGSGTGVPDSTNYQN